MFAIFKTGGKQYRVAAEDKISVMALPGALGDVISFNEVLALSDASGTHIGSPLVAGASVAAEIIGHKRAAKSIAFKKRRRQNSKRKRGHRQEMTQVRIMEFLTGGARPSAKAATPVATDHDHAGIAANAAASVAAAKAAGLDTTKFQKLDKAIGEADDLELIGGVGPTIAKKLYALGIHHFWQVVAMNQADIDGIEHEVGFKGRAERDHWREQAGELMAGKGPRAKVDQKRAATLGE